MKQDVGFQKDLIHCIITSKDTKISGKTINITDESNKIIGKLKVLDVVQAENNEIIIKLTEWRNRSMRYFLTQFKATEETTGNWVKNILLTSDDRLLYLIYDHTNCLIGHIGICNIENDHAELDNLIRGEMGGNPRLVYFSEKALLNWAIKVLKINYFYGYVLAHNILALNLHQSVGFELTDKIPLIKNYQDNKLVLEKGRIDEASPDGLYLRKIELVCDNKYKGWV